MKAPLAAAFAVVFSAAPLPAAEQVVTLGDSLTYAYEGEFCFRVTVPFSGTYGDNMPATVRNWIETLSSTSYRNGSFDQGTRITFVLDFRPFGQRYTLFLRNRYNWSIPGLKIDELRQFVLGEKTFMQILEGDEDFAALATALDASPTFNEETDFNVAEMNAQITGDAERLVLFIGGNDVRTIYGTVYNGGPAGTFEDDFIADAAAILDRVRLLNPGIQIIVVAVPHIGITPDIKASFPTDPVKTGLVTGMLRSLNSRLEALARQKGGGFADIFSPTLSLLDADPYGIHGIAFNNTGSATGDLNSIWLNGEFSANFHPNTNAQAVIANGIIDAFNRRYDTGIAPLTATEILGGLLGKSAAQIDMTFASWATGFGLTGLAQSDDSDHDGIPAAVEFATGLNPTLSDGDKVSSRRVNSGTPSFELAYPRRLPASPRYTLQATTNSDLSPVFTPVIPVAGTDGLLRASIPVGTKGFLRLESTVAP
jgi:hypothetical protein